MPKISQYDFWEAEKRFMEVWYSRPDFREFIKLDGYNVLFKYEPYQGYNQSETEVSDDTYTQIKKLLGPYRHALVMAFYHKKYPPAETT